jgi:UPF0755 protein
MWFSYQYFIPVDSGQHKLSVVVRTGDSFRAVARRLDDVGVVRSASFLTVMARLKGIDKSLTPGRYDFSGEVSARVVLDKLARADFVRIRVTIIEGASIWKVASILAASDLDLDSAEIVAHNRDSTFLSQHELPCLEGYLFPETYFFQWGLSVREVISEMVRMHRAQTSKVWPEVFPNNLSRKDVIILASIIEAEAMVDSEKAIISSVYHNRLSRKMKLDADPTVIYGLGGLERDLMRRDLRYDTPYNTYLHRGLPPTAINSPGLTAIKAALDPVTTDYLFFVADGSGGHRFSRTNAEHNKARREISRSNK